MIPKKIYAALMHVRSHCPGVDRVVFWNDTLGQYLDPNLEAPPFPEGMDLTPLEEAIQDLPHGRLPVAYQLYPI